MGTETSQVHGGVLFAERLLRWVTENAYCAPSDEFTIGLGAVWLSFCFDHDLNPFVELHEILETFPFAEALGTTVPEWATRAEKVRP